MTCFVLFHPSLFFPINRHNPVDFLVLARQKILGDGSDAPFFEIDLQAVAAGVFGTVQLAEKNAHGCQQAVDIFDGVAKFRDLSRKTWVRS